MIAVKRLQSLFWVLLVTLGALSAYMVSLRAATERNDLNKVRAQIAQTQADIRYLETEFGARANLRQLERWNAEDFRYSTPTVAQYLDGERALASLDGIQQNGPQYVAPPVMAAMVQPPAEAPTETQVAQASPAKTQIRTDIAIIRTAQAADNVEKLPRPAKSKTSPEVERDRPTPVARNVERMAMLDSKLLDDRTLGDLSARAAGEKRKGNR
ncbi:colicin transporter [Sphingobium sp. SCG-1]|uniref:colicin transporter n=1 Tax=Sphingobium sp. SCG-1 TaxID=2072936 RepID=UPI000CD6A213|nr:colicin transporter [Sphingobium sp. SCG-1]AUW57473.1 colicin transporter [Sphingobium sp. SCG-1]